MNLLPVALLALLFTAHASATTAPPRLIVIISVDQLRYDLPERFAPWFTSRGNDLHVPLMFWGKGVKHGTYDVEASPLDLARTVGAVVGVEAGGRTSRVLPGVE
jgi:hypothetical protein